MLDTVLNVEDAGRSRGLWIVAGEIKFSSLLSWYSNHDTYHSNFCLHDYPSGDLEDYKLNVFKVA